MSNIYTSQSGSSLNSTLPAAPPPSDLSACQNIQTKVLPILMFLRLDSVPSGSSLFRVPRPNWVSLASTRVWQRWPKISPFCIKGIWVPTLQYQVRSLRANRIVFLVLITNIRGKGIKTKCQTEYIYLEYFQLVWEPNAGGLGLRRGWTSGCPF